MLSLPLMRSSISAGILAWEQHRICGYFTSNAIISYGFNNTRPPHEYVVILDNAYAYVRANVSHGSKL